MIHPIPELASPPPMPNIRRLSVRQGAAYFLDLVRLLDRAVDRDLVTALTFLSIGRANMRAFSADRSRSASYAALDAIPPDSERDPVTVYAVARELGIPYETVRRHARKLREAGLCDSLTGGLIIPTRAFARPGMLLAVAEHWRLTVALAYTAAGQPAPAQAPTLSADVSRQVMRLGIDYFLDALSLMTRTLEVDALAALVVRAVSFANVAHLAFDPDPYPSPPVGPTDSARAPVSIYAVAKALSLPYETTRRHVGRLIEQDLLEKFGGGVIVPQRVSARPRVLEGVLELSALTETYLARLAKLGVGPGSAAIP